MSGSTPLEAWRCTEAFLRAVELFAEGDFEGSARTLEEYTTYDPETAERNTWSLVSVAPMITAQVMRRHYAGRVEPDAMWSIEAIGDTGLPIEKTSEPSALAATRAVVEHLNAPVGKGTDPALDLAVAHFRQHGPEGVMDMIVECVRLAASLWHRDAASEWPRGQDEEG